MKNILLYTLLITPLFAGSYASLLFHGNCITCHDITTQTSAPNIKKIQKVYKNAFPNKDEFVSYMSTWVYDPKVETSIMYEEIEKFGLMPHLAYNKEVLKEIAGFIYETDFK